MSLRPAGRRRLSGLVSVALVVTGLPVAGAEAQATTDTATSSNWSGYAVTGATFRRVSAAWKVPTVDCSSGTAGYTANWVGLGGNAATSEALEQTGTESDCTTAGVARYSAWWEVVPDAAHTAKLKVTAGDRVTASVEVSGHRVTMRLTDTTRGTSFKKVMTAAAVDVSSAEWILEAPAACTGTGAASCTVLPLADFRTSAFSSARATTAGGHVGTISDRHWTPIAITLQAGGGDRVRGPQDVVTGATGATATPGPLTANGGGFAVVYGEGTAVTVGAGGGPGGRWEVGRRRAVAAAA